MKKGLTYLVVLAVFFLTGTGVGAQGKQVVQRITAVYQDINIVVNGRLLDSPLEPFMIEGTGTTMVPIRFISEALNQEVTWDNSTSTIYIGKSSEGTSTEAASKSLKSAYLEELPVLRNVGPFFQLKSRNIAIASREFNHGLVVEVEPLENGDESETLVKGSAAETVIDLKGQYATLEGYLGVDDETRNSMGAFKLTILGDGIPKYESHVIKPADYPYFIQVDIKNVKRLAFRIDWEDQGTGDYEKVWAAFANFEVY